MARTRRKSRTEFDRELLFCLCDKKRVGAGNSILLICPPEGILVISENIYYQNVVKSRLPGLVRTVNSVVS